MSALDPARAQRSQGGLSLLDESANLAINCGDDTRPPPSVEALDALFEEFGQRSPLLAATSYGAAACAGWPHVIDPAVVSAVSSPPPLVFGGNRDPLTPSFYAEPMRDRLEQAVLVISDHQGHRFDFLSHALIGGFCRFEIAQTGCAVGRIHFANANRLVIGGLQDEVGLARDGLTAIEPIVQLGVCASAPSAPASDLFNTRFGAGLRAARCAPLGSVTAKALTPAAANAIRL